MNTLFQFASEKALCLVQKQALSPCDAVGTRGQAFKDFLSRDLISVSLSHFILLFRKPTYFHPGAIYRIHFVKQLTPQFCFFFCFVVFCFVFYAVVTSHLTNVKTKCSDSSKLTWENMRDPISTEPPFGTPAQASQSSRACLPWSLSYFAHLGNKLSCGSWTPATYIFKILWSCFSCCL